MPASVTPPPAVSRIITTALVGLMTIIGIGTAVTISGNTPIGSKAGGSGSILQVWRNSGAIVAQMTSSGSLTLTGTLLGLRTTDIGWNVAVAANQACNTTCSFACVFGEDTSVLGSFVACSDATADRCLCAGPN